MDKNIKDKFIYMFFTKKYGHGLVSEFKFPI